MNCNGQIIIFWDRERNDGVCKWPFPGRHSQNETKLGKWFALTSGKSWSPGHPWKALTYEWEENSLQCTLMAWGWTEGSFKCYQHYADRKLYIPPLKKRKERTNKQKTEQNNKKKTQEERNLTQGVSCLLGWACKGISYKWWCLQRWPHQQDLSICLQEVQYFHLCPSIGIVFCLALHKLQCLRAVSGCCGYLGDAVI